jgi:LacI family transcriptional regulator
MVSQRDIADAVGVSVATVSTVLANKFAALGISEATADRVRREAQRLGYRRNLTASGLRTRKHYAIGLMFFNPSELLYGELLTELQASLTKQHYAGVCAFWHGYDDVASAFESVVSRGVDGILTCHSDLTFVPDGVPVVTFEARNPRHDCVYRDGGDAVRRALRHLLGLGHRRLGLVNMNRSEHETLVMDELQRFRVEAAPVWVADVKQDYLYESRQAVARLLDQPCGRRPTALICRNDTVAMQAMSVAGRMGLRIPADLSVVGFDNVSIGAMTNPPLTTLGVTPAVLAGKLVDLMMRRLEKPGAPVQQVKLRKQLVIRDSSAPPPDAPARAGEDRACTGAVRTG